MLHGIRFRSRKDRGSALVEVLTAGIILVMATGYITSWLYSAKKLFRVSHYQYIALNLARDILEWGASGTFSHQFRMRYYYAPGGACSICPDSTLAGTSNATGYELKEWWYFMNIPAHEHPFRSLGDIEARGLVPKGSPKSVDIYYEVVPDPAFDNAFRQYVSVSWEEDGQRRKRELSTISLTHVNDQLNLRLAEFTWH